MIDIAYAHTMAQDDRYSSRSDDEIQVSLADEFTKSTLGGRAQHPDKKTPFDIYVFENLLSKDTLEQLRDELNANVELLPKNNDLYKFKQSKDLRSEIDQDKLTPLISSFSDIMLEPVRSRLEHLSGLKLSTSQFDITASRYDKGNYLLCHNDDIKDPDRQRARALAFIFYLNTRPWTSEDGGALILYDSDTSGEPVKVNNYIHPKPNSLVVFKTGLTSWHSVQEVSCSDDVRLSINGWFHLDNPSPQSNIGGDLVPKHTIEPSPFTFYRPLPLDARVEKFLSECINEKYMTGRTSFLIRKQFKRKSELNLPEFLVPEKYKEISEALKKAATQVDNVEQVGPYSKRNYSRFKIDKLPQICRDLYDAFRSEPFFMMLWRFTGLDLQPGHFDRMSDSSSSSSGDDYDDDFDSDEDSEDEMNPGEGQGESDVDVDENGNTNEAVQDDSDDEETSQEPDIGATQDTEATTSSQPDIEGTSAPKTSKKRKSPSDPLARLEFRHLDAGSYTLLHDYSFEQSEKSALDVILHFNHEFKVNFEQGGYIGYTDTSGGEQEAEVPEEANGSGEDLLSIEPECNSLSLVYRSDSNTCRYLKYITRDHKSSYQDLSCVYYEQPEDLPSGAGAQVEFDTSSTNGATKKARQ